RHRPSSAGPSGGATSACARSRTAVLSLPLVMAASDGPGPEVAAGCRPRSGIGRPRSPDNRHSAPPWREVLGPSDYRLAPAVAARLMGLVLVAIAVMVFVATGLVIVFNLHSFVLVVPLVLALLVFVAAAVVHQRRGWVVRLTSEGYKVQWVRGVG